MILGAAMKRFVFLIFLSFILIVFIPFFVSAQIVVFYEKEFPAFDNANISKALLERALARFKPRFVTLNELMKAEVLNNAHLLVFPYGSAFPVQAWESISQYAQKGNILVIGGNPFTVPVLRKGNRWVSSEKQNTYSRSFGIFHFYAMPKEDSWVLQWDEDAPSFSTSTINARQVFVNAGYWKRYRGLAYFINEQEDRVSAPVVAEDVVELETPARRRVYLSFDADSKYWQSKEGVQLIQQSAFYAMQGGIRIWLNIQHLTIEPGGCVTGNLEVTRNGEKAKLKLEIIKDSKVLGSRTIECMNSVYEPIGIPVSLHEPGLYQIKASLYSGDTIIERYSSGVIVRDTSLLYSGQKIKIEGDYFWLNNKPYLMVGVNYFCNDPYTSSFFAGGSLGGNVWAWEKDFREMRRIGITAVRTGIWLNRFRYLDDVSKRPDERLLRAIEAYLHVAGKYGMQVIFTFFAFEPQTELQQGPGQQGNRLGPGANPYIDPVSFQYQKAYVTTITSRFRKVPFLSFDLINEPSFNNPNRLWMGNSPNGDPVELSAWQNWLRKEYRTIDSLAYVWRVPVEELKSFNNVPIPSASDLQISRYGNTKTVRAVDFNRFAQDAFSAWVQNMVSAIRESGASQIIGVGQDEGGVADRLLNQFWGQTKVDYTSNHTWWRDDALLWSSVAAKTLGKPNLIGETGIQPVWSMDGTWRWNEIQGFPLLERKLVLSFANGNAGVLYWDWTKSDTYGLLRSDGSYKIWTNIIREIATFANKAQDYFTYLYPSKIAIVLPQSLQLSPFLNLSLEAQQKAVRALYNYARLDAFAIGEYQIENLYRMALEADATPTALPFESLFRVKLMIVPSPWILNQKSWETLMKLVERGVNLLISGRIDADEHWIPVTNRLSDWNRDYTHEALIAREAEISWAGNRARLTYSGDKTTFLECGKIKDGRILSEISIGKGRIFYSPLPLEFADQLDVIADIYRYVIEKAEIKPIYETTCKDPGVLICPTQLSDATLYVLASESNFSGPVEFKDMRSGASFKVQLPSGRAVLLLIDRDGKIIASYNASSIQKSNIK